MENELSTLEVLELALKENLRLSADHELTSENWGKVHSLGFAPGRKLTLNEKLYSKYTINWDLHEIFRCKDLKKLSLTFLHDHTIFSAGGLDAFTLGFWFKNFENLRSLYLRTGAYEDSKELHCCKLKDIYVIHSRGKCGFDLEIYNKSEKIKSFHFGDNKKISRDWFMWTLSKVLEGYELPSDEWFEHLKTAKFTMTVQEQDRLFDLIES
jgi:hypothetical protein